MTPATVAERAGEHKTDKSAIRPLPFEAADAELDEMRRRIAATRFPEKEPVADPSLAKGGHLAAWEQPQLFSEEVRAGFRALRG